MNLLSLWSSSGGSNHSPQQTNPNSSPDSARRNHSTHTQPQSATSTCTSTAVHHPAMITDIEELHRNAVQRGERSYEDPATGFSVFTELFFLQRGTCCGNQCRHCPYGWENVGNGVSRPAKLKSGDGERAQQLLSQVSDHLQCQLLTKDKPKKVVPTAHAKTTTATNTATTSKNNTSFPSKSPPPAAARKTKVGGTHGGHLTDKNVPYTKKGDQGTSQLLTGEKRSKDDLAFEAMGTIDELCTVVGLAHSQLIECTNKNNNLQENTFGDLPDWLVQVMSRLFDAGSHVAKPAAPPKTDDDDSSVEEETAERFHADGVGGGMNAQLIVQLEEWIDIMTEDMPELRHFILPTGSPVAAQLHVCRTVCRRAERRTVPLVQAQVCDPNVLKYLNRLSDFFFAAARWCNYCQDLEEVEYRKAERRDTQRIPHSKPLKVKGRDTTSSPK